MSEDNRRDDAPITTIEARVSIPSNARRGEILEIRTLTAHPMETGFRIDTRGERISRHILTRLRCYYDDRLMFDAELHPAIAANPYIAFSFMADRSGEVRLEWLDDRGATLTRTGFLEVSP